MGTTHYEVDLFIQKTKYHEVDITSSKFPFPIPLGQKINYKKSMAIKKVIPF